MIPGGDGMFEDNKMHCDEYRRLHAAFLIMAEQSKQPDERDRWFTLAQDCLGLANDPRSEFRKRKCAEDRSKSKPTGSTSHVAIGPCAALSTVACFAEGAFCSQPIRSDLWLAHIASTVGSAGGCLVFNRWPDAVHAIYH
jgi:hypothetical protein